MKIVKILQLNVTSLLTSHNQLIKFYQEQNGYDIIALQETNVKDQLELFKIWWKFHPTFTEKKTGFGVDTLTKNDIKNVFVSNIQSNLEAI